MKSFSNQSITAIVVGLAGLLLIIFEGRGDLLRWIAVLIGIMFIIPSAFVLVSQLRSNSAFRSDSAVVASVGGLLLGICMCVVPGLFVGIFIYLFAFMLILGGVSQIVFISRSGGLGGAFYVVPVLLTLAGIVMLFAGIERDASAIVLIMGIGMVLYSINTLIELYRIDQIVKSGKP